ncbi:MAG TPA: AbrB/MazE/SpoVT family DNA-binding domain-containing protein [Dehalococcoidia bacterium]|nr:AbrB/MazE/SpoVT family DNA-binding domain-containing protein [Dehalococcoidia bacterium]
MELKKGKKFYGSVTVSERGQIAIPAEARKDFAIKTGDKLLVLGDLERGIALAKSNFVLKMLESTLEAMRKFETVIKSDDEPVEKKSIPRRRPRR